jgi:hypothetical protein
MMRDLVFVFAKRYVLWMDALLNDHACMHAFCQLFIQSIFFSCPFLGCRYPLVRAADRALKTNGFRIMLLLRMCPVIPFNGLNYCSGITGVTTYDFCMSLVGILPFQIYTVLMGASAGALELVTFQNPNASGHTTHGQHVSFIVLMVTGGFFALVAMVYAWRLVKIELQRELQLTSEEFEILIHPTSASTATTTTTTMACLETPLQTEPQSQYPQQQQQQRQQPDGMNEDDLYYMNGNTNMNYTYSSNDQGCIEVSSIKFQEEGEEWYWVWA